MYKLPYKYLVFLLCMFFICFAAGSFAQANKKGRKLTLRDSLRERVLHRDSIIRSYKHANASVNALAGKIEDYTSAYVDMNNRLVRGFDTLAISEQMPLLEKGMENARKSVNKPTTLGYLVSIRGLVDHLKVQVNTWEDRLTAFNNQLDKFTKDIAAFKKDTTLKLAPADSNLRLKYTKQIAVLDKQWASLEVKTERAIIELGLLENRVSALTILLIDIDDRIDFKVHEFAGVSLTNEAGYLWDLKPGYNIPFENAAKQSFQLNFRLYRFFLSSKDNFKGHLIAIFLFALFLVWLLTIRNKLTRMEGGGHDLSMQTDYVVRHPYLSAFTLITVMSPYCYDHAAQIFSETIILVMMLVLEPLIKDSWPAAFNRFWRLLCFLAIVSVASNLLIFNSLIDRVLLLALSAFSIFKAVQFIRIPKTSEDAYPPHTKVILQLFVVLHAMAILLNLAGRFSLAKILAVSITLSAGLAMGFYILIQILMETLFLQLEVNKISRAQNFISYMDFKIVQKRFKGVLVKIVFVLWLLAFAKFLTIDDYLYDVGNDFLNHPYKFGSTAFTFRSILVFVVVIWLSGLLARVISYFYDFAGQQTKLSLEAKKTRSSILLIRLTVFIIGFFIAITAAGIPMDRVTIVIGALGVGIGFGLQNLVNNLVSGIILAFEKPVQVGDIIEVSGKSGTITDIGIRSSKIECGDGSELIVPNGDLISQHVINWTLTNNNKRVELIVRVAFGSDVVKTEEVLANIVNNHDDIMKIPEPEVFINSFGDTAIEFRAWFWAEEISKWLSLKSSVMREIYLALEKEGIELAQSQKEIQLMLPDGFKPGVENSQTITKG